VRRFLTDGVWDVELSSLSRLGRMAVKNVRIAQLVARGFIDDDCALHAAALTFSSLMAVVPVLALSLALARGLGGAEVAQARLRALATDWTRGVTLPGATNAPAAAVNATAAATNAAPAAAIEMSERVGQLVDQAFEKVGNVSFKALGGVGLIFLVIAVIQVLGQVELSFNRVWGVTVGRSLWRKFSDYLSVLLVLPLLMIAASSLPAMEMATRLMDRSVSGAAGVLLHLPLIKIGTVWVATSLVFVFLIMFMPNTRVRLGPGLLGGLAAGALFLLWIRLCKALQLGVAGYSRIYGSFALVPILLLWIFVSWEIVLLGAELAFAMQNVSTYRMERGARDASLRARLLLALSVLAETARGMQSEAGPFDAAAYARERRVPVRFLNEVLDSLVNAGLLARLSCANDERYALLKSPQALTVAEALERVLQTGVKPESLGLQALEPGTRVAAERLAAAVQASVGGLTLAELAGKAQPSA